MSMYLAVEVVAVSGQALEPAPAVAVEVSALSCCSPPGQA